MKVYYEFLKKKKKKIWKWMEKIVDDIIFKRNRLWKDTWHDFKPIDFTSFIKLKAHRLQESVFVEDGENVVESLRDMLAYVIFFIYRCWEEELIEEIRDEDI